MSRESCQRPKAQASVLHCTVEEKRQVTQADSCLPPSVPPKRPNHFVFLAPTERTGTAAEAAAGRSDNRGESSNRPWLGCNLPLRVARGESGIQGPGLVPTTV